MVDDRSVHFEDRDRVVVIGGGDPLAREVVVTLDDDIRSKLTRDVAERARVGPPQCLSSGWRRQRDPMDRTGGKLAAGRDDNVNLVFESSQALGDSCDVNGSACRARYRLV